jgi:hypothetical protein
LLAMVATLPRKSAPTRHSRVSGNPLRPGLTWTPAFAGLTTTVIFISQGQPKAHDDSSRVAHLRSVTN